MSIPVTPHFSLSEFASHDGAPYPAEWIQERLLPLCQLLEAIRIACDGRPISITSGYRSPAHNLAVGGAQHSQHMEGRAADIEVEGMAPSDVHARILALDHETFMTLGGLGLYGSWCHVDIRPRPADGHLATWTGTKVGDEVT